MPNWSVKKQLVAILGGGALVAGLAVGGVFYAQGLIEEVEANIEAKQQSLAAADAKLAQVPGLEKEVVVLRENLGEFVKILPDTKDLADFLRMVNQFQRQCGIVGTSLMLRPQTEAGAGGRFSRIEYTYESTATIWQFLKLMSLIENYERFISITEFSIQSGDKVRKDDLRDGEVVHTVRLTMQTYKYNGTTSTKEVQIPDYEQLKESLREEIFKSSRLARVAKFDYRGQQGRRDILVDPRLGGEGDSSSLPAAEQRKILDSYVKATQELREMLQRMKRADTTMFEQYALEKRVREGMQKLATDLEQDAARITFSPYRVRWAKEVVAVLEDLRSGVDQPLAAARDPYLPAAEMEQLLVAMGNDCNQGNLEEAKNRFETVASRLLVPAEDPRHALAVRAKALHTKASTALEFRGLELKIQGVVVHRGGRSAVLINGDVYEEGDFVNSNLLVKRIEEEQVWFVFRGLTVARTR
ncbi:MAG: type 4a pilus biogenesis protein PilO [Planctomycetes bacterium]|nr:type 4a pilus biogenesis protein PilO [Planctomycetota bacterium]